MTFKTSLPILLSIISVFPVLSQDQGTVILSDIISTLDGVQSSTAVTHGMAGALDYISPQAGASASPLDYVAAASVKSDPYTTLVDILSPQDIGSEVGALDMITGVYDDTGFYKSGIFGNTSISSGFSQMGRMEYYSPEWGRITSGFGYRPKFNRMHKGIDIAMCVGDTVRVALPGVVGKVAYEAKGYGHYVVVRHDDGIETRYAHLSHPLVVVGQRVMAREAIGLSGNTGNSTGPHLHFETRYQGVAIDPASVFDFTGNQQAGYFDTPSVKTAPATRMATGFNGSKQSLTAKSTYVVREGDTPRKIASRAGISVYRLCQLNFITETQKLEPGTMLKLR